jgi:cytochrome c oxidase assembly protein subunit 15
MNNNYFKMSLVATFLALVVVMLGAYTRLSDAGLGCPDWPGCYGQFTAPHTAAQISKAQQIFPNQAVVPAKAWAEMVHRFFAGALGLFIMCLTLWAYKRRFTVMPQQNIIIPTLLSLLVIFQAVLGMWTVTWLVLPLIVMMHLLAGMSIAALLWALSLTSRISLKPRNPENHSLTGFKVFAILGLCIIFLQIFLGAWTSTNYASIICPHFPYCQGKLFPNMNFYQAFNFFSPIGVDYQGGVLNTTARITIQMMHRYGAFITASYVSIFALWLLFSKKSRGLRLVASLTLLVLLLQVCLGVVNIEWLLPMPIAVAHNGVAAILLLLFVTLVCKLYVRPRTHSQP